MRKLKLLFLLALVGCGGDDDQREPIEGVDFRQEMRDFVIGISEYARSEDEDFVVIPQNGIELVTSNGEPDGTPNGAYLSAIDGNGQEDLYYGYDEDDKATPEAESEYLADFLDVSLNAGNTILVTDYCSAPSKMDDSYSVNESKGYISFAADERELFSIPDYPESIHNENNLEISSLSEVRNFLYLINPDAFSSKTDFINAVTATNYDLIIMDLFFHDDSEFSASEITSLRSKADGGSRMVICYMSIGEAEDYRYYWQSSWNSNKPDWMEEENPDWEGNFKVRYWEPDWQNIIYGSDGSYLKKILDAGFDGVYLDIIDGFEYFE